MRFWTEEDTEKIEPSIVGLLGEQSSGDAEMLNGINHK